MRVPIVFILVALVAAEATLNQRLGWKVIQKAIYRNGIGRSGLDPHAWLDNSQFKKIQEFARVYLARYNAEEHPYEEETCGLCKEAVKAILDVVKIFDWNGLQPILVEVCKELATEAKIDGEVVCKGFIDIQLQEVYKVITWPGKTWDPSNICSTINACIDMPEFLREEPDLPRPELFDEQVSSQSDETHNKNGSTSPDDIIKIVQMADLHTNLEYAEGSATECNLPMCCRFRWKGTGSARKWGEYLCNVPQRSVDVILQEIREQLKPDFIIYTGDSPPHTQWDETFESQRNSCAIVAENFKKHIPGMAVYPNIGNHDLYPTNQYYQPGQNAKEMTKYYVNMWSDLIPGLTNEQKKSMEYAGYYTALAREGLRILSFNTVFGYVWNWYTFLNSDVIAYADQKNFMNKTLADARTNNEKVIMVGHIPPSRTDSLVDFSSFYEDLVLEYSDVIVLQVYGHTHKDEFKVFMSKDRTTAKSMLFINPSVTSNIPSLEQGGPNPSVRVYHLSARTFQLQNYQQYILNLTRANQSPDEIPKMELLYSARDEYSLKDMSAGSYLDLSHRLDSEDDTFHRYYRNRYSGRIIDTCDATCRAEQACFTKHTSLGGYMKCVQSFKPLTTTPAGIPTQPRTVGTTQKPNAAATQSKTSFSVLIFGAIYMFLL